jgi:hypothetical protein
MPTDEAPPAPMQLLATSKAPELSFYNYREYVVRDTASGNKEEDEEAGAAYNTHSFTEGVETNGFFARTVKHGRCHIKTVTLAVCSAFLEGCDMSMYAPAGVTLSTYAPIEDQEKPLSQQLGVPALVHLEVRHAIFSANFELSQRTQIRNVAWKSTFPGSHAYERDDHLATDAHIFWQLDDDAWWKRLATHIRFCWSEERSAMGFDSTWLQTSLEGTTSSHWLQQQYKHDRWYARKATQLSQYEWTQIWWTTPDTCPSVEAISSGEHAWTIDLQTALDTFVVRNHAYGKLVCILETRAALDPSRHRWATVRTRICDTRGRTHYDRRHTACLALDMPEFGELRPTEWCDDGYTQSSWHHLTWTDVPLCIPWPLLDSGLVPLLVRLPLSPNWVSLYSSCNVETYLNHDEVMHLDETRAAVITWNWLDRDYAAAIEATGSLDECLSDQGAQSARLVHLVQLRANKVYAAATCTVEQTMCSIPAVVSSSLVPWSPQIAATLDLVTSDMRLVIPGVAELLVSIDTERASKAAEENENEEAAVVPPAVPWPGELVWDMPWLMALFGVSSTYADDQRQRARHTFCKSQSDDVPHLVKARVSFAIDADASYRFEAFLDCDTGRVSVSRRLGCLVMHFFLTHVLALLLVPGTSAWRRLVHTIASAWLYAVIWCTWVTCQYAPLRAHTAVIDKVRDLVASASEQAKTPPMAYHAYVQWCFVHLHNTAGWLLDMRNTAAANSENAGMLGRPCNGCLQEVLKTAHTFYHSLVKPIVGDALKSVRDKPFPTDGVLGRCRYRQTPQDDLNAHAFRFVSDMFTVPLLSGGEVGRALHVVESVQEDPAVWGALSMRQVFRKLDAGEWSALQSEPSLPLVGDWIDLLLASASDKVSGRTHGGGNKQAPTSSSSSSSSSNGSGGSSKVDIHTYTVGGSQGTSRSSRDTIDERNQLVVRTRQGQVRSGKNIEFLHKLAVSTCPARRLCMVRIAFRLDETRVATHGTSDKMRISRGNCVRWIRPVEVRKNQWGGAARLIFLDQGPGGERELDDCPICMDAPPDTLLLDCQHMLCAACARKWLASGRPCYMCQQPVVDTCRLDRSEGLLGERRGQATGGADEDDIAGQQRAIQASLAGQHERKAKPAGDYSSASSSSSVVIPTPKPQTKLGRWWRGVKKTVREKVPVSVGGDEPIAPDLDIRGAPILEAKSFIYEKSVLRFRVGKPVVPLGFDANLNLRCSSGLHGFRSMSHPELVQMAEHYHVPQELCTADTIDHPDAPEVEATLPLLREIITHTGLACDLALLVMQYALVSNLDQAPPRSALKTRLVDATRCEIQEYDEEEEKKKEEEGESKEATSEEEHAQALVYLRTQVALAGDALCELYPDADIAVLASGTEQAYLQCHRRRLVEWLEPARLDRLSPDVESTRDPVEIQRAVLRRGFVVVALHFPREASTSHPLERLRQKATLPPLDRTRRLHAHSHSDNDAHDIQGQATCVLDLERLARLSWAANIHVCFFLSGLFRALVVTWRGSESIARVQPHMRQ